MEESLSEEESSTPMNFTSREESSRASGWTQDSGTSHGLGEAPVDIGPVLGILEGLGDAAPDRFADLSAALSQREAETSASTERLPRRDPQIREEPVLDAALQRISVSGSGTVRSGIHGSNLCRDPLGRTGRSVEPDREGILWWGTYDGGRIPFDVVWL